MKKVFPFILITSVILGIFFGIFKTSKAEEQQCYNALTGMYGPCLQVGGTSASEDFQTCGFLTILRGGMFSTACLLRASAGIAQWVIYTPGKLAIGIGGYALNKSADLSINQFATFANSSAVNTGWGLGRDIVNIFLIFILLYIAIATILQLSGFNTKQLLTTLIVIAFLVNFSLVITKLIIDASNILALEFYKSFPQQTSGETTSASLASTFTDAFDADVIVNSTSAGFQPDQNVYLTKLLTYTLGGGILLIAGFIFLIFGILFLIRMVTLMILMIFSPLAFAAHVLPSTKQYAKQWWDQLFSQAFFAPAALFMLWISANIANSGFIKQTLGLGNLTGQGMSNMLIAAAQSEGVQAGANWDNIIKFILQFIIIAILLCASLVVAKRLGAIGADAVQKGVANGLRKAQGYAGRIGKKYGTIAVGKASEGILKGEGRVAKTLKSLPLVSRGLARVSGLEAERSKKQVEKYKKGYGNYSDAGLKELVDEKTGKVKDPTIFGAKRKALEEVAAERKAKEKKKEEKGAHKKELDAAIKSGNIMEIMAVSARMQAAAAEETGEAAEKLSAAAAKEIKAKETKTSPPPKT